MRVILNVESGTGQRTGVGIYAERLLEGLRKLTTGDQFDCFPGEWTRRAYDAWSRLNRASPRGPTRMPRVNPVRQAVARLLFTPLDVARRVGFQARCWTGRYDLYHEPNFIPFQSDIPSITTVHDLSFSVHPAWYPKDRLAWWERQFIPALSRSAHFLVDTDFVKAELVRICGVSPDRITRIHLGIREEFAPLPADTVEETRVRLGLPSEYLLHVGAIQPRKNLLMLMEAYCALPAQVRENHPLVLAGPWGWSAEAVAEFYERRGRAAGVIHIGYIEDRDLPAVYNGAHALVYPSHYEGFGLPPLEMMACGGAVLASTAGALVETTGKTAALIDPEDTDGWRQALLQVCTQREWWSQLRSGARAWAGQFTWERCARETLAVYRKVTGC
jgi:glycosyltransferase involved in cell wall biosynthesis